MNRTYPDGSDLSDDISYGHPILADMESVLECECGSKEKVGQGHSHWCKRFRKEF